MRKITVTGNETIRIGRTGENRAVQVIWPGLLEKWRELYGDGTVQLAARRPKDTAPYPVVCEVRENDVMWTVQAADTAQYGIGECELTYLAGEVVAKSQTWATEIFRGLTYEETIEPPDDPAKTWFTEIRKEIGNLDHLETEGKTNLVSAINEAAQSGGEDGGYYAPSVDSGGNLTWTASKAGMPQVSGANIKGPKGGTGVGIASIARTSGTGAAGTTDTYTITLTDGSTSTFTVYNGKDGASGSGSSAVTSVNGKTGDVKLPVSGFGTCATAAATAIKVVDGLPEDFLVEDGVQLCVKFSNANTAAAPQLSVAGASAPIFDARTSNNVDAAGIGARTHHFVYFSGIWVLLDALYVDTSLTISGKAADAKATGDALRSLSGKIANYKPVAKTTDMTNPVGVDENGQLWTAPTSNNSADTATKDTLLKMLNGFQPSEDGTLILTEANEESGNIGNVLELKRYGNYDTEDASARMYSTVYTNTLEKGATIRVTFGDGFVGCHAMMFAELDGVTLYKTNGIAITDGVATLTWVASDATAGYKNVEISEFQITIPEDCNRLAITFRRGTYASDGYYTTNSEFTTWLMDSDNIDISLDSGGESQQNVVATLRVWDAVKDKVQALVNGAQTTVLASEVF